MERLTIKVKNEYITDDTKCMKNKYINKLGQLEDLMEKYDFETVEDLDGFIQSCINRIDYENKKEKLL